MPFEPQTKARGGAQRPPVPKAHSRRIHVPPRSSRLSLALLAAFAVWNAPARAADECGAPAGVPPTVTCTAAPNPYALGITYLTATALTVNVTTPVAVLANAPNLDGLRLTGTGAGELRIKLADGATITTNGIVSAGVRLLNQGLGQSFVESRGAVTTVDSDSSGLALLSDSLANNALHTLQLAGNATVNTFGGSSHGLRAVVDGAGQIEVRLQDNARVSTSGALSHGVDALGPNGVNVFTGISTVITVQGSESMGSRALATGPTTTDHQGQITASGEYGVGIYTHSVGGVARVNVATGASVMGGWAQTPGDTGSDLQQRSAGVVLSSGATSVLDNLGTIGAMGDRAVLDDSSFSLIFVPAGNLTLLNSGTITGFVQLAGGGTNTVTNGPGGLFEIRHFADTNGDGNRDTKRIAGSDFGDGATSVFNNIGTLRLGAVAGTPTVDTVGYYVPTTGIAGTPLDNSFYRLDRVGVAQGQLTNLGTFRHSGTLDLRGPVVGNSLVITGNAAAGGAVGTGTFVSDGGHLYLNAVLNDGVNSHADMLIVDRTQLGLAPTTIHVGVDASSLGAVTPGNGIQLVEVRDKTASAPGVFVLPGPVSAGAFDYQFFHNGVGADAADGNWYLRNFLVLPGGAVTPTYSAQTPLYMAVPALTSRLGLAMLGNYHDRLGDDRVLDMGSTPTAAQRPAWGRLWGQSGETGRRRGTAQDLSRRFQDHGPATEYDLWGLQVGLDLDRKPHGSDAFDTTGAFLGLGNIKGSVDAVLGGPAGSSKLDSYSLGGYWSRKADSGVYVDAVYQATYTKGQASSVQGQRIGIRGWGHAASLEGGISHALGGGWAIEPQAQLVYQHMDLDRVQDDFARVDFGRNDAWFARLGARLTKRSVSVAGQPRLSWVRVNVWHNLGSEATTTFSDLSGQNAVRLNTALGGVWGQLQVGHSARFSPTASAFVSLDYNVSLDGAKGHALGGRVGFKLVW